MRSRGATGAHGDGAIVPIPFPAAPARPQVALVGQCAGGHDAAFVDQIARRRIVAHLVPELLDVAPSLQRAVGVGEDGVLFGRARQFAERLELDDRRFPFAQAVQGQTVQLADFGHRLGHAGERSQRAPGVVVALGGERSLGFLDASQRGGRLTGADGVGECLAQIDRAGRVEPGNGDRATVVITFGLREPFLRARGRRLVVERTRDVAGGRTARHAASGGGTLSSVHSLRAGRADTSRRGSLRKEAALRATPPHDGGGWRRATASSEYRLSSRRRGGPLLVRRPSLERGRSDDRYADDHCADDPTTRYADDHYADDPTTYADDHYADDPTTRYADDHYADDPTTALRGRSLRGRSTTRYADDHYADDPTTAHADQHYADDHDDRYADDPNADDHYDADATSYADDQLRTRTIRDAALRGRSDGRGRSAHTHRTRTIRRRADDPTRSTRTIRRGNQTPRGRSRRGRSEPQSRPQSRTAGRRLRLEARGGDRRRLARRRAVPVVFVGLAPNGPITRRAPRGTTGRTLANRHNRARLGHRQAVYATASRFGERHSPSLAWRRAASA